MSAIKPNTISASIKIIPKLLILSSGSCNKKSFVIYILIYSGSRYIKSQISIDHILKNVIYGHKTNDVHRYANSPEHASTCQPTQTLLSKRPAGLQLPEDF